MSDHKDRIEKLHALLDKIEEAPDMEHLRKALLEHLEERAISLDMEQLNKAIKEDGYQPLVFLAIQLFVDEFMPSGEAHAVRKTTAAVIILRMLAALGTPSIPDARFIAKQMERDLKAVGEADSSVALGLSFSSKKGFKIKVVKL